jgi:uncharacterized protein YbjT (DUF2867 family)
MKVLVYGATGSQQWPLVSQLVKSGHQVLAVTHDSLKATAIEALGAEAVVADMSDRQRVFNITKGVEAVCLLVPFFLPIPKEGLQMAKNAIDAAVAADVKKIIWNSSGFINDAVNGNDAIDIRIEIKRYLEGSNVPYIIFQPSVYAENLLGSWTAPFVAGHDKLAYPAPPDMPIGWVVTEDIARLTVAALEKTEFPVGSFRISGLENLTGPELAKRFEKALNRPIEYLYLSPHEFGQILDSTFGEGAGRAAEAEYQKLAETKQYPILFTDMSTVLKVFNVTMTPLEDWVRGHKSKYSLTPALK